MTEFADTDRIGSFDLAALDAVPASPEVAQERKVAVFDLLEENRMKIPAHDARTPPAGPYRLRLAKEERKLVFDIATEAGEPVAMFQLSLTPFKRLMAEYFAVCDSYYDAVKHLAASQIEAIDMGRRGLHDDASALLRERLSGKIETDKDTARRLFTLICALEDRAAFGG